MATGNVREMTRCILHFINLYVKIEEETDKVLKGTWQYFVVTLLVSGQWRIPSQNGPNSQTNPTQLPINHMSVLKLVNSNPWA